MKALTGLDLPAGNPGGSVELLHDLYLAPNAPVQASVFMLAAEGATARGPLSLLDIPGKQLDGPGFWRYAEDLANALKQRYVSSDFGILHLQHLAFGATPALLRAFPGHPSLALVHGTDLLFADAHPTQAQVLAQAVGATNAVVVPTSAMADLLRRVSPMRPREVVHIPWGVPDHLLHSPPPRIASGTGDLRVLYAGRLTEEKGAAELISAWTSIDGIVLSIAAPVREFAALNANPEHVHYLGWLERRQLWRAFAEHDVLVVPSTRLEAFGLVAVEAQACGLPVVYQPVPGLSEVLGGSALALDLATGTGALSDVAAWMRKDPSVLDDLRTGGYQNARRFPLSATAAALRQLSDRLAR